MTSFTRSLFVGAVGAAALLLGPAHAQTATPATPDPIEGKWFGTAEQPGDPAGFGFEFKRDAKGQLVAFHTNTTIQFADRPVGPVTSDGVGQYLIKGMQLALTLHGDELLGELATMRIPVRLARVEKLPEPSVLPDYPAAPAPRWKAALGAPIYAEPAVHNGFAYVGTTGGLFHAVDLKNGRFKWAFPAGRPIHGEALATDDAVYFVCDNGYLFKLDCATGKEIWRYDLGDERVPRTLLHFLSFENDHRAPRPVLADGAIYVGSGDGGFHAVDAATGTRRWRFAADGKIRMTAALSGANIIFGTFGSAKGYAQFAGTLYALDRATGTVAWRYDLRGALTSVPTLVGDKLIVGTRGSILAAFNPADGTVLWQKYYWGSWVESTPVPAGDLFYLGSADLRTARAYDPRDGSYRWSTYLYGWGWGAPALADQTLYYTTGATDLPGKPYHAGLIALDRATGQVKWRWAAPELPGTLFTGFATGPVLAGDLVLAAGLDGTLYAFPIK